MPVRSQTEIQAFPSLTALHADHLSLLQRLDDAETSANDLPEPLLADIRKFAGRVAATGAKLSFPADRNDAQSVLTYWAGVLRTHGLRMDAKLLEGFDQAEAISELAEKSPYKGLTAFQQEDADLFFGRRELVTEMVRILGASRLLTVLGLSGSGKSSVVRAGLLPALRDDAIAGSKYWVYLPPFPPGADPLGALAKTLSQTPNPDFLKDPKTLARLLNARGSCVLVIDQLEEAFAPFLSEADRDAFFGNLAGVLSEPNCRHRIILTMRSEFDSLLAQTALRPWLADSRIRVPSLGAADLRDAIERPAERFGVHIDQEVVQSLIKNVLNEPAGLPLLEFALMKLWQKRKEGFISKKDYEDLGGTPQQILVKAADESLASFLLTEDHDRCRVLFLRLIRTGASLEVTSRRRTLGEIRSINLEQLERLIAKLEPDGLLRVISAVPRERSTVEVSHESLTRNWPQFVEWVRKDLAKLRRRELLEETVDQWLKAPKTVTSYYSGGQLTEALEFPDLSDAEKAFLEQSKQVERITTGTRYGVLITLIMLMVSAGFGYWIWKQNAALKVARDEAKTLQERAEKAEKKSTELNVELKELASVQSLQGLKGTLPAQEQQALQVDKVTVYFQIPDESDIDLANNMINAIKSYNDKVVLPGVQRLDPAKLKFPKKTQLRYFRPENGALANQIANVLSKLDDVQPILIGANVLGQDRINSLPPSLFEIWIGTDVKPTATLTPKVAP